MKTEILRLGSVVPHGVGGTGAGAIGLIYSILMQRYDVGMYRYILVNQIGDDLQELIWLDKDRVDINIRYPAPEDYEQKTTSERDIIRLDIIHKAMLRLTERDPRISQEKIEAIRNVILHNHFYFEFVWKEWRNTVDRDLKATIIINPLEGWFDFYIIITKNEQQILKKLVYSGKPTDYYINEIFSFGKWKTNNEFIITDKSKEVEIHVIVDSGQVKYINLSSYDQPPFFEMMRADLSKENNEKAYRNWLHSLPPDIASVITYESN